MTPNQWVAEDRKVCGFDRVILRVYNMLNEVQITQGDHESLTIEASPEILAKITTTVSGGQLVIRLDGGLRHNLGLAFSTSLTRPTVRYFLAVKDLNCLDLAGFVRADAAELRSGSLGLKLKGAGEMMVGSLTAQTLAVDLEGAGRMELSGQVKEQRVAIKGPGFYQAPNLKSQRASLSLKGIGRASVWAVDELEVKVRGLGQVEVRGTPAIKKDVSPRVPLPGFGHS
jgi:hypothetical protein